MHASLSHTATIKAFANRMGPYNAPYFRSCKNTTNLFAPISGLSRDGGARRARDGV